MFPKVNGKQSFPKLEEEVMKFWRENDIFKKSIETRRESEEFNFYDGPPFATGTPHYGHILAGTIKDVIPRYQTMLGKRVDRVFGWDCHGLPIENIVEKKMGISGRDDIENKIGVFEFNEECRANVFGYVDEWKKTVERMGRWVDMENDYKTMDAPFMESVWWVFKSIYDKGLIYEGNRVVPYCPRCTTPLSNFEVNQGYKDKQSKTVTVKFKVDNGKKENCINGGTGIIVKNPSGQLLLGKKKSNGLLTFPGGKPECGEDFLKAAIRELREETGIKRDELKFVSSNYSFNDGKYWNEYIYETEVKNDNEAENPENHKYESWKFYDLEYLNSLDQGDFESHSFQVLEQINGKKETNKILSNGNKYILAWTTTPWTLYANLGLAVGADIDYVELLDKTNGDTYILAKEKVKDYYKKEEDYTILREYKGECLVGIKYEPIFSDFDIQLNEMNADLGTSIRLGSNAWTVRIGHHVTTDTGTGIVHIAPAYGEDDFLIGEKEDLGFVAHIDNSGKTYNLLEQNGKFVFDFNEDVVAELKEKKLSLHIGTIVHSYPHCWRCDTPLIYRGISAWYVAVEKIRDKMVANNLKSNWTPDAIKYGRFGKWLEQARDWNISRNRYWGSALPIWQSEDKKEEVCIGSIEELYEGNKEFGQIEKKDNKYYYTATGKEVDLHKHFVDEIFVKNSKTGSKLKRIPEVLDCWFESGSMPYASKHYPFENKDNFKFPADFIAEGLDQTRGWFYTLIILSTALYDSPATMNTIVNGIVLAEDGKKMSKSLKNYPDPNKIFDNYGADAMRFYLMNSPVVEAQDLRFSEAGVEEVVKKTILPLWNTYSFFTTYANIDKYKPSKSHIYFCRHGETTNNAIQLTNGGDIVMNGGDAESLLTPKGEKQAKNAGNMFKFSGVKIDVIVTSPRIRAKKTAEIIASELGYKEEIIVDDRLNEIREGVFLGMTHSEVRQYAKKEYGLDLKAGYETKKFFKDGKYNKVEDVTEFDDRVVAAYKNIQEKYKGKNVLLVGHTGVFRPINRYLTDIDFETAHYELPILQNATIFKMPKSRKNILDKWIISELNKLVLDMRNGFDNYRINEATRPIMSFMDNLTNWYIRRSRKRFWASGLEDDKLEAYDTLYEVLVEICKIIAPVMPFVSEHIYRNLTGNESVHLESFPNVNKSFILNNLNSSFDKTAKLVNLGLAFRSRNKLRVRQPLASATIGENLDSYYLEVIKEELNVKEIFVLEDSSKIAKKVCRPNAKLIGPKFGKDVQKVIVEAKNGNFEELEDGKIKVGEFVLESGEYEMAYEKSDETLDIEAGFGMVIAMDSKLTSELIAEGYARDLVRHIQESRKEADFEVDDRIQISIVGIGESEKLIKDILNNFKSKIETETLSTIVDIVNDSAYEKEIEFEEYKIKLVLRKV